MIAKLTKNYRGSIIPVININGLIQPTLTEQVVQRLRKINVSQAQALAVVVNSPGGLPAQSQIIAEKLKDYSSKHNLKLYTFAKDIAAAGGYLVLSAGDHVVADHSSLVGSIGVVFHKLKLKGLLQQYGVDHKHFASNSNLLHDVLSPFAQTDPAAQEYLKKICDRAQENFVGEIKRQRGKKIKDDASTFSGDVFVGREAQERGLVDEVGSLVKVLAERHPGARLQMLGDSRSIVHKLFNL